MTSGCSGHAPMTMPSGRTPLWNRASRVNMVWLRVPRALRATTSTPLSGRTVARSASVSPASVSSTSRPPAPSTTTRSWRTPRSATRATWSPRVGRSAPSSAAAGLGAMGARRRTPSTAATPVRRCTSAMSPGSPGATPVCVGLYAVTLSPAARAVATRAAVTTVLPTSVSVPVTRTTRGRCASVIVAVRWDGPEWRVRCRWLHTLGGRDRREATDGGGSVPCPWPLDGSGVGSPAVNRGCPGHESGGLVEVVAGQVGTGRDTEAGHAVGHARWPEAADEDTLGAQVEGRGDGALGRRHRQRLDGSGRLVDATDRRDGAGVGADRGRQARVVRDQARGGAGCGGRRGGEPGVEDEAARGVDEVVAHRGPAEHGTALGSQRLRQGQGHDDVAGPDEAELVDEAAPVTGHPDAVRLVDDEQGAVTVADLREGAQGRGIAEHGVDRLDGDEDPPIGPRCELAVEGCGVVVGERGVGDPGHPGGVVEGGVRVGVEKDLGTLPTERGQHPEVGGIPRREGERARLAREAAQGGLEVAVDGKGAGDEPARRRRGAVALQRLVGGRHDAVVAGQAEVVVGGEVERVTRPAPRTAQTQDGVEALGAALGPEVGTLRQPRVPAAHPWTSATAPTTPSAMTRTSSSVQTYGGIV